VIKSPKFVRKSKPYYVSKSCGGVNWGGGGGGGGGDNEFIKIIFFIK
jgi:hypothetical protein